MPTTTLRVSAPRVHCGRVKTQGTVAAFEQKLIKEHADDPNVAKLYVFAQPTSPSMPFDSSSTSSMRDSATIVRMESSVLVDRIRTGGNDPSTADETNRAFIVLCTGHGSVSMLGSKHSSAAHVGAAELARLASHSLLGELQIAEPISKQSPGKEKDTEEHHLIEAFRHCRERLQRSVFDGASRNSSLNASLLDGAYFSALMSMRPLQPATVVGKTVEIVDGSPAVKYVCHSGQKVQLPALRVCAIVLDCDARQIRCATAGDGVAAALFKPVRQNPGEQPLGKLFTCEWLSNVHGDNDLNRILTDPNVVHQSFDVGQWIVVGNSGFWQRDNTMLNKIALYLAEAKNEHSNDPNRVADALLELAMKTETDNVVVVVATVNKTLS